MLCFSALAASAAFNNARYCHSVSVIRAYISDART